MLSCFGSSAGAGAAAPPPACVVASGVDSGSCVVDGAGDSDGGACVVGIGDGVGLGVGDGVGLGVGDGEGVGVGDGDGDGETVTVGEGAGAGEPASSAKDGTPHPARPAQTAMARAADADLAATFWRREICTGSRLTPVQEDSKNPEWDGNTFMRTSIRGKQIQHVASRHAAQHSTRHDRASMNKP